MLTCELATQPYLMRHVLKVDHAVQVSTHPHRSPSPLYLRRIVLGFHP